MTTKFIYILTLLLPLGIVNANAGSSTDTISSDAFLEVVRTLTDRYNGLSGYSVDVLYRTYTTYETAATEDEYKGFIHRKGFDYSSCAGNVLMLRNSRVMIAVDSVDKTVVVSDPRPDIAPEMLEFQSSWVKNSAKSITSEIKNGLHYYKVVFKVGFSIKSYEFALTASGFLSRIVVYYDFKREEGFGNETRMVSYSPRLEITFGEYNLKPVFKNDEFSEKRVLKTSNNKFYFLPTGSPFQLFDQRLVKPD
jgi:hypothetical protein